MLGEQKDVRALARPDRRQARRDATRNEIIDAAWELARVQGLAGISLRDLADRVGMRAPSLYQYFASKNAIYDAMFKQGAEQALEIVSAPLPKSTRAALRETAHRFFDFATSDPARAQLLFERPLPDFEPTPEAYAPAEELIANLRAVFDEHRITDPDAVDLWTALLGGLVAAQNANDPGGDRYRHLIDRAVDMYLSAIKKKGTQ
jgi:AcrR family transcriptional regulator